MSLRLDHVVILVRDLEAAVAQYVQLGFAVERGGTHADGATHNALIGFEDGSYLELIAFLKAAPSHRWAAPQQAGHWGLIDFALLPDDIEQTLAEARSGGAGYEGPIDGGRARPDGQLLKWQFGWPASADLPFLCADLTPRALRVPEGSARLQPNGVIGVRSLSIAVRDLDASVARYAALLNIADAASLPRETLPGLGLRCVRVPLAGTELVLMCPVAHETTHVDVVRARLVSAGEGLIGIALAQAGGTLAHVLPTALTSGAWIELHPA